MLQQGIGARVHPASLGQMVGFSGCQDQSIVLGTGLCPLVTDACRFTWRECGGVGEASEWHWFGLNSASSASAVERSLVPLVTLLLMNVTTCMGPS